MKIGQVDKVSVLRLVHKGTESKFMCYLRPQTPFDVHYDDLKPSGNAVIRFDDLLEVDALIDILTRFKEGVEQGSIGVWKKGERYE